MPEQEKHVPPDFSPGLYEQLLVEADRKKLTELTGSLHWLSADMNPEDRHAAIAQYLERLVAASLAMYRGKDSQDRQQRLVERIIDVLTEELHDKVDGNYSLADPLQRLLFVGTKEATTPLRPNTPLSRSALLTGTRLDPSLGLQLQKEIASADRVDILVSFIKWSGLRLVIGALRSLTETPREDGSPRLRLITTSYMGATDPRAIEALADLPNSEIQVSYDTKRTRLHAKAYIIHRRTGFGTAYIGSANLSHAALSEGLEWTPKISQYELPYLWTKITGTFDTYWNDEEFESFDPESRPRFRTAINRERHGSASSDLPIAHFDLHPYPYQEEILDVLAAEREVRGKTRQLIVAATGTGKTMIAAFDYKRWSSNQTGNGDQPSLLFIAHREEILNQALGTFRAVLRDQNFGDLLVGGREQKQQLHLFCSIQSYNSRELMQLSVDHFDYVVVDEFHHAEAASYKRLLAHVRPKVLLGMTATPERADGLDVYHWFDDEASANIRLPDAINRRLLCPFHYFGIADAVDLSGITWKRGRYDISELENIYTGNDVRASLILDKVRETVLDPHQIRALGFCVSVVHANFMARFFNRHDIPAAALSAESSAEDRRTAQRRLVGHDVNVLFVVDLYNEGVDIPEVDTVLLLRPTESLTVYLQQLGRGLRLTDDKDCLTVLDFVGSQNRNFRFASRFREMLSDPAVRLDWEVEQDFPHLPSGCAIQLERVAKQRVLENIRQSLTLRKPMMIAEIQRLGRHIGREPSLKETVNYLHVELDDLLKRGLWSYLLHEAGLVIEPEAPDEVQLSKGLRRFAHIDDLRQIRFLLNWVDSMADTQDPIDCRRVTILLMTLYGPEGKGMTSEQGIQRLRSNPAAVQDVRKVLEYRLGTMKMVSGDAPLTVTEPLSLHASYTRDEILAGLGHWTMDHRPEFREGVLHLPDQRLDVFFITLHKSEEAYSPTTMYDDYAVSDQLFHWQSQSTTSADSPTGQRYIHHRRSGYTPLLFVREYKKDRSGLSVPYQFLGPADYVSHEGSRPMSIVWRMRHRIPARLMRKTARQAIV